MRAGLVGEAAEYPWSSAAAHVSGQDKHDILDMEWWRRQARVKWNEVLNAEETETGVSLRTCTYAGRPFGSDSFVSDLGQRFGRKWTPGRPRKQPAPARTAPDPTSQFALF